MKMNKRYLLISVRPKYADLILSGAKTVELRRTRPNIASGDRILLYVSSPEKSLKAVLEVLDVIETTPHKLWNKSKQAAGIERGDFFQYFEGARLGYGILLRKVWIAPEPVNLSNLRSTLPGFHPPQVYRYLSLSEVGALLPNFIR